MRNAATSKMGRLIDRIYNVAWIFILIGLAVNWLPLENTIFRSAAPAIFGISKFFCYLLLVAYSLREIIVFLKRIRHHERLVKMLATLRLVWVSALLALLWYATWHVFSIG